MIVFNMLVLPSLTTRLGIKTSSRLGSVFEVPLYFVLPLLSWVNSAGHLVAFASLILRFTAAVCSNSVSGGHCGRGSKLTQIRWPAVSESLYCLDHVNCDSEDCREEHRLLR